MLISIPPLPYEFLEELVGILGEPREAKYLVSNLESFEHPSGVSFKRQGTKLSGNASLGHILQIYRRDIEDEEGRDPSKTISLSSLSWFSTSDGYDSLSATFKPTEFEATFTIGYETETARELESLIRRHYRGKISYTPKREKRVRSEG